MTKKALILLPGLLCDKALWRHQIKALAGLADVKVPDLTSHSSISELARHVLAEAPKQFSLAGLSMGGYVALEIMRTSPERVKRLALIDTSARPDTDEGKRKRRGLIELSRKGNFKGVTPRLLPMLISAAHLKDKNITQVIFDMAERVGMEAFIRQQKAIMGRMDSRPSLAAIKTPTTIICGAEDALTPKEMAEEMVALIKGSTLHIIPESGHLSPLEQPGAVNEVLKGWLTA